MYGISKPFPKKGVEEAKAQETARNENVRNSKMGMNMSSNQMLKEKKKKDTPAKRGHVTSMGKSIDNVEGSLREYLYPKGMLNMPDIAQSESGYLQIDI